MRISPAVSFTPSSVRTGLESCSAVHRAGDAVHDAVACRARVASLRCTRLAFLLRAAQRGVNLCVGMRSATGTMLPEPGLLDVAPAHAVRATAAASAMKRFILLFSPSARPL